MTLVIDLPPELEDRLRQEAAKHGLETADYALRLIERQLPPGKVPGPSLWETLPAEAWKREFRAWIASHDPSKPPLPPEAFERASFYGERG